LPRIAVVGRFLLRRKSTAKLENPARSLALMRSRAISQSAQRDLATLRECQPVMLRLRVGSQHKAILWRDPVCTIQFKKLVHMLIVDR
jgi:hypothetical protein